MVTHGNPWIEDEGEEVHLFTCSLCILHDSEVIRLCFSQLHWASKETYHFFRATLTKIHTIKINNISTQNKL